MALLISLLACSSDALCLQKEGVYAGTDDNGVTWQVAVTTTSEDEWRDNNYNLELAGQVYAPEMAEPVYDSLFQLSGPEVGDCSEGDNAFSGRMSSELDDNDELDQVQDDGWVMTGTWDGSVNEFLSLSATYEMTLVSEQEGTVEYAGELSLPWDRDISQL